MLKNLFVSSLTASQAPAQGVIKGEDTLFSFIVDNEPALFFKIASYWLYLAWQYHSTGGRYTVCLEYVLGQLNENVNLALFNIDSFKSWLEFIKTLPCVDAKD